MRTLRRRLVIPSIIGSHGPPITVMCRIKALLCGSTIRPLNHIAQTPANVAMPADAYDADGELVDHPGIGQMQYDTEGRMTRCVWSGETSSFQYDGMGHRVAKTTPNGTTTYVYDAFDHLAVEYSSQSGGTPPCTTCYLTADWLGSTRVTTDGTGAIVAQHDYEPSGEELVSTLGRQSVLHYGATDGIAEKFTGKERDSESGLDYFGARYFSSAQGRFTSPDPIWIKIDRLLDPQRLNLYSYGRNNPLKFKDPTGMDLVLGKCSGGDTQKCFERVQQTVAEKDRSHIHLVTGNGKNGFQNGQYGITVDKDYKGSSGNFTTLQTAANNHDGIGVLNVVAGKEGFASNVGTQQGASVTLQGFKSIYGVDNYVSAKDAVPGQTLFPLIGSPLANTIYTPSSNAQIYVANDQPEIEIVKTLAHELVHLVLGDFGRTVPKAAEDAPGVKPQLDRAEQEAGKNYRNQ